MSEPEPDPTSALVGMAIAFAIAALYESVMPMEAFWWSYALVCAFMMVAAYLSYRDKVKGGVAA